MLDAFKALISKADVVHVRPNALRSLSSISFLGGGVFILWLASGIHDDPIFKYLLFGMGSLPFVATVVAYFIWMFRDPDRLQSEEYVLRRTELSIYVHDAGGQTKPLEEPERKLQNVQETAPPQIAARKEEP